MQQVTESGMSAQYSSLLPAYTRSITLRFAHQTSCSTPFDWCLNRLIYSILMMICPPPSIPCSNASIFKIDSLFFPLARSVIFTSLQNPPLHLSVPNVIFPSSVRHHIHFSRGLWVENHLHHPPKCLCL